jgi:hypothetical protein
VNTDTPILHESSDAHALDAAATTIAVPRVEPGDSFILHAPLELLARAGLLTLVDQRDRDAVLDQMHSIADRYAGWGTALEGPRQHSTAVEADAATVLTAAVANGDAEAADDAITWLTARLDTGALVRTLADPVLPSLAAAAHGSILLYLLPRVAAGSMPAAAMARTTVHELVRNPDWTLNWIDGDPPRPHPDAEAQLRRRLTAPAARERPANTFIYPTMSVTDRTGLASDTLADLVPGLSVRSAARTLLRTAALSMLQDDPDHAPYGWSHCLTMPQATLGIAHATTDPARAIAVAATFVLGFRSTLGSTALDHDWEPDPAAIERGELVAAPPAIAAAAAWHTPADERAAAWRTLATHAGAHPDAHLAKYTLACIDAARSDAEAEHLYLSAAAFLNSWWSNRADR